MDFDEIFGEEEFAEESAGAALETEDCVGGLGAEVDHAVIKTGGELDADGFFSGFGGGFFIFVAYFGGFFGCFWALGVVELERQARGGERDYPDLS